jgi:integral membrane sensor domain MASE1
VNKLVGAEYGYQEIQDALHLLIVGCFDAPCASALHLLVRVTTTLLLYPWLCWHLDRFEAMSKLFAYMPRCWEVVDVAKTHLAELSILLAVKQQDCL